MGSKVDAGTGNTAAPKTLTLSVEALVALKAEHAAASEAVNGARGKVSALKASVIEGVNTTLRNIDSTWVLHTLCDRLGIADLASPQGVRLAEVLGEVRETLKTGANVYVTEKVKSLKGEVDTSELTARRDAIAARFDAMRTLLDSAGIDVASVEPIKAARTASTAPRDASTPTTRGVKTFTMRYSIDGKELAESQQSLSSLAWYGYSKAGVLALKAILATNGIEDMNTDWSVTLPNGKTVSARRVDLTPAEAETVEALTPEAETPMAEGSPMTA